MQETDDAHLRLVRSVKTLYADRPGMAGTIMAIVLAMSDRIWGEPRVPTAPMPASPPNSLIRRTF